MSELLGQGGYGDPENFPNYAISAICMLIVVALIFVVAWLIILNRRRLKKNRVDGPRGFPLD